MWNSIASTKTYVDDAKCSEEYWAVKVCGCGRVGRVTKAWCDVARDCYYKEGRKSMSNSDTRKVSCIIGLLFAVTVGRRGRVAPIKRRFLKSAKSGMISRLVIKNPIDFLAVNCNRSTVAYRKKPLCDVTLFAVIIDAMPQNLFNSP